MWSQQNRSGTHPARRRRASGVACAGLVLVSAVAMASPASAAGATRAEGATTAVPLQAAGHRDPALQRAVDAAVRAGSVGYVARVDDGRHVTVAVAGLADRATGRRLRPDDQFEIGSNTKTFMATITLQLVGEGRLKLSDSVEQLLPGVVPGGDKITLKMLLQHTSGIFNYTNDVPFIQAALADPTRRWTPAQLVAVATKHKPDFAPGTSWNYSNTNYILVGMILQRATGQSPAALLRDRIARPLGLRNTYLVTDVARHTGSGYAHGYAATLTPTKRSYVDVSGWSLGSWANTAGAVVSTASDLSRFFSALLGGHLLRPAQLAQMRNVVPVSKDFGIQGGYGLGLMKVQTPCGTVWGHGGDTIGHHSTALFSADGRRATVADATTQADPRAPVTAATRAAEVAIVTADLTAVCRMNGKALPANAVPKAA